MPVVSIDCKKWTGSRAPEFGREYGAHFEGHPVCSCHLAPLVRDEVFAWRIHNFGASKASWSEKYQPSAMVVMLSEILYQLPGPHLGYPKQYQLRLASSAAATVQSSERVMTALSHHFKLELHPGGYTTVVFRHEKLPDWPTDTPKQLERMTACTVPSLLLWVGLTSGHVVDRHDLPSQ